MNYSNKKAIFKTHESASEKGTGKNCRRIADRNTSQEYDIIKHKRLRFLHENTYNSYKTTKKFTQDRWAKYTTYRSRDLQASEDKPKQKGKHRRASETGEGDGGVEVWSPQYSYRNHVTGHDVGP